MQPYPAVTPAFQAPSAEPVRRKLRFQFTGNASEYFRIWIVNTLLTIVTLGIYSAWAKVRNKQYFYRNTIVDGSSFEYLADPIPILKGRLIAAAAIGLLFASQYYSLTLYGVLALLFVLVSPWVMVKALAFNARNSSYRNIRFAFTGRTGEAAAVHFGMLLFYLLTCGLAGPYAEWRITSFVAYRHLYGDQTFAWQTKASDYYKVYVMALLITLPGMIGIGILALALGSSTGASDPAAAQQAMLPALVAFYAFLLVPTAYLRSRIFNLVYGGLTIGEHRLSANQRGSELLKLYVTNLLGIALSLGLLIPWAKVRLAKYKASCLVLHAVGSLRAEKLLDEEAGALGEGLSDLGDFDIGIGT